MLVNYKGRPGWTFAFSKNFFVQDETLGGEFGFYEKDCKIILMWFFEIWFYHSYVMCNIRVSCYGYINVKVEERGVKKDED